MTAAPTSWRASATSSIPEGLWPQSYHADVVDRFERIPDRESLLTARRLAREEGLLAGGSSGTAVAAELRVVRELGPDDLVVVLLPDSGRSYLSKIFSDEWLRQWGFLEEPDEHGHAAAPEPTVRDVLDRLPDWEQRLVTVSSRARLGEAISNLPESLACVPVVLARSARRHGITATEILGSIEPAAIRAAIAAGRASADDPVLHHLGQPLPTVGVGQPVGVAYDAMGPHPAAIVLIDGRAVSLIMRDELSAD